MTKWIFPEPANHELARLFHNRLHIPPFVAAHLVRLGIGSPEAAEHFLQPRLKTLSDPFLLPNMERAVERIFAALDRKERIVLYGDYDVDGVTSLALFTKLLRAAGADPQPFLPLRMDEGYGLTADGVKRCVETHRPQLLIAVDCGTSAVAEITALQAEGVDVLVFDHHECAAELPPCVALVNPKLGTDFHYLCSAGVVFKACHALLKRRPLPGFDLREQLDLVALGTIADIVPLVAENRLLVHHGLLQMAETKSPGLLALMDITGVKAPLSPTDIGFRLGPRLNAAGRLGTAEAALDLLLTDNASRARMLAGMLDQQNRERQGVEQHTILAAEKRIAETFDPERDAAIVVSELGWHPGVIGIVASRLVRRHHRPTFVIAFDDDGVGKGSGRSINGFSLVEALTECGSHLERFGGHEMAAGLTIRRENFPAFRDAFLRHSEARLSGDALIPRLHLDGEAELEELDLAFLKRHEMLQPFGIGNPQPLLCLRGVAPACEPRVLKEKHLMLTLRQGRNEKRAIYFNSAVHELPRPPWDVACRIEANTFNGRTDLQIQVQAIRAAE
jgi:single-stranded-DNA-specific exonuclease